MNLSRSVQSKIIIVTVNWFSVFSFNQHTNRQFLFFTFFNIYYFEPPLNDTWSQIWSNDVEWPWIDQKHHRSRCNEYSQHETYRPIKHTWYQPGLSTWPITLSNQLTHTLVSSDWYRHSICILQFQSRILDIYSIDTVR